MKRIITIALGTLVVSAGAFAQDQAAIDKALMAAPANQKATATVIKWKADGTYDTLKKGTGALVCYDKSGMPGQGAVSIECTLAGNMERAAQNIKMEAMGDRAKVNAALNDAEKDGTRVKPVFGSVWYHLRGMDLEHTSTHMTIAVPGATGQSLGLPESGKEGKVWVMNPGTSTAHLMTPGE
ncbi:MAG TPA: conjugal transfer protein TraD [Bryobacteraceae bacterium]|jgi:hypothetical protein|nr:conjugal transfer protein TraD [Bryobacteraceae bacterium]